LLGCSISSTVTTCPDWRLERFSGTLLRWRQQDVLADALVLGDDETHAVLFDHAPDHEPVGPLGNLDDLALRPALAIDADDTRDGLVTMQHLVHFLGGKEQVAPPSSGTRKPKPSGWPTMRPRTRSALFGISQSPRRFCINCASRAIAPKAALERHPTRCLDIQQFDQRRIPAAHPARRVPAGCIRGSAGDARTCLFALELRIGAANFGKLRCYGFLV
jgi:hypothetical protein